MANVLYIIFIKILVISEGLINERLCKRMKKQENAKGFCDLYNIRGSHFPRTFSILYLPGLIIQEIVTFMLDVLYSGERRGHSALRLCIHKV